MMTLSLLSHSVFILFIVAIALMQYQIITLQARYQIQVEAVKRNFAKFERDKNGQIQFTWKDKE